MREWIIWNENLLQSVVRSGAAGARNRLHVFEIWLAFISFFFVVAAVRSKSTVYVKPETYLYETIEPLLRGRFFGEWFLGNSAWLTCLVSWECYDWLRFPLVIRRAMLLAELNCWKLSIVYLRNRFEQFVFVWFYVTLVTHGSAEGCFGDISV